MPADKIHAVDLHVGRRITERRLIVGFTQTDLSRAIGVTFQQVQKYERGTNRVSASKLWEIAAALNVPITFFFDGLNGAPEAASGPAPIRQSVELNRLALLLPPRVQGIVINLMRELAGEPLGPL